MNSTNSSSSSKPQIFINHVDQSITEQDIKQACESMNTKPTSITIRQNHDQKGNNISITFASENEAKTLKGSSNQLVVKNIPLKLEDFQNMQPANVFLKNVHSLTEEQLQEGMKKLIKGYFHMNSSNHSSVFFYIQDNEDINLLINQQHEISGKPVRFEKFEKNHSKNNKNTQLYVKFTNVQNLNVQNIQQSLESKYKSQTSSITSFSNDRNMHYNNQAPSQQTLTFSISFNDPKVAEEFHNELKEKGTYLDYPVSVQWKRPEDSDDKTVFLKFLNTETSEQQLQNTLSKYGEILSIELFNAPEVPNKPKTKSAYVIMATESGCKNLMDQGVLDEQVKKLFLNNRTSISPYISKNELNLYKNAVRNNTSAHPFGQNQQNQFMNQFQQYPPYMQMNYPPFFPGNFGYPGVPMMHQNQQRKQGHPQQYQQFHQQQAQQQQQYNMNYQHNNQHKKGGNHRNNGYQNNYYNQNNYQQQNNNQNQNFNNNNNHHQKQQWQNKAKVLLTQQQLQQELETNPQKFDNTVREQTRELVYQHLNRDPKYKVYVPHIKQIVDMLTDKDVFEPAEIIALIFDEKELSSRIEEGIELIKESQGQN